MGRGQPAVSPERFNAMRLGRLSELVVRSVARAVAWWFSTLRVGGGAGSGVTERPSGTKFAGANLVYRRSYRSLG